MQSNAGDEPLRRFRQVVFSITDDRVAKGRELRPNLVLQSGHQFDPDQRSIRQETFHGISKFSARRLRVSLRA